MECAIIRMAKRLSMTHRALRERPRNALRWSVWLALLFSLGLTFGQQRDPLTPRLGSFASLVSQLSERPGYFDTDNLVSNERSYLHVAPDLLALRTRGRGVYLGVGPDQNFSYIAQLRPSLAILVDIRRDNLLLHLLFKALFAEARTRTAYLATLTGRSPPADERGTRTLDEIIKAIDRAAPLSDAEFRALRARVTRVIGSFGVPLSDSDLATIDRFHRRFAAEGLSLRFNSFGRQPQYGYPTFRELLVEVDRQGIQRSYLSTEEDFQFVKRLHADDRIVPIVGNLSGPAALAAVARLLAQSNQQVAAFYTSNVEFYLFGAGSFADFVANLRSLPRMPGALVVRSVFGSGGARPLPGYNSVSLTQPIDSLVDGYASGRIRSYRDLTR
jgi:hypothetical protein